MSSRKAGSIEVLLPKSEAMALRDSLMEVGEHRTLLHMMQSVDCSRAEASVPEDEVNIRRLIEGLEGGYAAVDAVYKSVIAANWLDRTFAGACFPAFFTILKASISDVFLGEKLARQSASRPSRRRCPRT